MKYLWLLLLTGSLWAQTTLTQTTLSQAVNGTLPNSTVSVSAQNFVYLASVAGIQSLLSGVGGSVKAVLFVDREQMAVESLSSITNQVNVLRGYNGTLVSAHNTGATVFVGTPDQFFQFDPIGGCIANLTKVTPWINIITGNQWVCSGGAWSFSGGPYFASSLPAGPSSPNGVPQFVSSTPSGGIPGPTGFNFAGVVPRPSACSGNVDTILATDRGNYVSENDASACAVTLPQAGTAGFTNNFFFVIKNIGAGNVTITPTISSIDGNASATLSSASSLFIYSDNTNYFSISPSSAFPDLIDTPGSVITSTVPFAWSAGTAKSGNAPQWFRLSVAGICFAGQGDTADVCMIDTSGVQIGSTFGFIWTATSGNGSGAIQTGLWQAAANMVGVGSGTTAPNNTNGSLIATGGVGVNQISTSTIAVLPTPVKADTANANQVVITTTTDTGAGIVIGVAINGCTAALSCRIITTGVAAMILGTGTCAIGNFVIVDTTTNGRVQCTATYTAGTVIGKAMAAQNTVGNAFNVMVGLR